LIAKRSREDRKTLLLRTQYKTLNVVIWNLVYAEKRISQKQRILEDLRKKGACCHHRMTPRNQFSVELTSTQRQGGDSCRPI
jgi:hypothetical protein